MYTVGKGLITRSEFLLKIQDIMADSTVELTNKNIYYYNVPAAFDIETTSFYDHGEKRAIMYHWQFGIYNLVTTGRTWEEYIEFIEMLRAILSLSDYVRLIVYVHNLPFEFQFIRKIFDWQEVFLLDERKPVYANNHGIEYRCSLKLAGGKSLESVGNDLQKYKVNKASGDLDYNLIRTPLTPMTEKELYYCEMDIRVILCYIQEKIETDGGITKIPLTNTGYVRNYCRKACYGKRWSDYYRLMQELTITPDEYIQLKRAFQGGFTHANANYSRQELSFVGSDDFTSSYPATMVLEKFPMSKATLITEPLSEEQLLKLLREKCCMFDIEIFGLVSTRFQDHPLSKSKCIKESLSGCVDDNGRVVCCEHLKTTITEQDYFIYKEFYEWECCIISNLRVFEKGYLPTDFVISILELYRKKNELKGIEKEIINYMISKNMLNAGYGMMVTDPLRDEYEYVEDTIVCDKWGNEKTTDYLKKDKNIEERLDKYNKSKNRFLYYPWGVWVTAYARANLFSGIIAIDKDYVYADTDSIKSLNRESHKDYFDKYNEQVMRKIKKAASFHNIPVEMFMPKGKPIGFWDFEGIYRKFKTLGAKRYFTAKVDKKKKEEKDFFKFNENGMEIEIQNNLFAVTLAGANKRMTTEHLIKTGDPFKNFDDKLIIPPESSGRLLITYIDYETSGTIVDYTGIEYNYHELSSVHMESEEYNLSLADNYKKYLNGIVEVSE